MRRAYRKPVRKAKRHARKRHGFMSALMALLKGL